MKKKYLILILILSIFILLLPPFRIYHRLFTRYVYWQVDNNYEKYLSSYRDQKVHNSNRDSLLIKSYAKQRVDFDGYISSVKGIMQNPVIGNIFYSPDSMKILCFYAINYQLLPSCDPIKDSILKNMPGDYYGFVLIGYREQTDHTWKLFPAELIEYVGYIFTKDLWKDMRLKFLSILIRKTPVILYNHINDNKFDGKYIIDNYDGSSSVLLNYCLPDPRFWDDALFIRNNKLKGCYDFEVKYKDGKFVKDTQDWFVIPDSIKAMYKTE